ncbi:formate acetyltransferase [Candidatus Saccharibacteria bacterium]|nr:formate acetyltransferase [Candidatus Saccharibacteria bacterium]
MQGQVAWQGFKSGDWNKAGHINVFDFIEQNYREYKGEADFLETATARTKRLWKTVQDEEERQREQDIYEAETTANADVDAFAPGFISEDDRLITGLQTDRLFKRPVMYREGIRNIRGALEAHGLRTSPEVDNEIFAIFPTHNDAVFDLYTPQVRKLRSTHILSALPDNSSRGRLIGDYRRVALYGVDYLIEQKQADSLKLADQIDAGGLNDIMQLRQEVNSQIKALKDLKSMALKYGHDLSGPATNFQEAVHWLYFAYLAACKQQDGAAMSVGRIDSFLDIYAERDLKAKIITERGIQEIIDDFVIKLRVIRFLRHPNFDEMYAGNPIWATLTLGGMLTDEDGKKRQTLVTKTSYRLIQTIKNLGPAPEPNLTVLWDDDLPKAWKEYVAKISIDTSTIQFENDRLIRQQFDSNDATIGCCVSPMVKSQKGQETCQLFGARFNLGKVLLAGLNGGLEEFSRESIFAGDPPVWAKSLLDNQAYSGVLDYDLVWADHFLPMLKFVIQEYVAALNIIHYSCDRNFYESLEMALYDTEVFRTMGFGIAGLSHVVDSLSAIKYARVEPVVEDGVIVDFVIDSDDFPRFGNNDDRADDIALKIVRTVKDELMRHYEDGKIYRQAYPTLSLLTITANVAYGAATGALPDGAWLASASSSHTDAVMHRVRAGRGPREPFAPGANPSNGKDQNGIIASMASLAKIPFADCLDGISLTITVVPQALASTEKQLVEILDTMTEANLYHCNINVVDKARLLDAYENPDKYNYGTIVVRVSGYAVDFLKLPKDKQLDVINRTFHDKVN